MNNQFDFPVIRETLFTKAGREVGQEVIVRTDTDAVMGVVGKNYELVPHREIIAAADTALMNFGTIRRNIRMDKGGARLFADYDIVSEEHEVDASQGYSDKVVPRFTMTNSYDGQLRFGFTLGAMQLVCTNGLRATTNTYSFSRKHSSRIDIRSIIDQADAALSHFVHVTYPRCVELGKSEIVDVDAYFKMLEEEKHLPQKLVAKVKDGRAHFMRDNGRQKPTEWIAYSGFTSYLTHDFGAIDPANLVARRPSETRREELTQLVSSAFGL